MVSAVIQPSSDLIDLYALIPGLYDVDVAVGQQLDVVGQWVGISRNLDEAISGVYFAFDIDGVGFDQGVWLGPFDPITGITKLPDDIYRILIKVKILNNHWDGTKETAYALVNQIFQTLGYSILIEDPSDLTMALGLVRSGPSVKLIEELLFTGKLNIKPAGVRISYFLSSASEGPLFGFDINNSLIAGFDTGSWATIFTP